MEIEQNGSQTEERKRVLFISSKIKRIINWTKEEDRILLKKAKEFKYKNWKEISGFLPGRSDIQCSARYKRIRPGIVKGSWTADEDQNLLDLLKTFGKNWSLISKYMPSRSGKQIRDRYLNTLDPSIKKEKFSKDEDAKIIELFIKHGPAWSKISSFFHGRTGDMIKNRFYSSLKRRIKNKEIIIDDGVIIESENYSCGSGKKKSMKEKKRKKRTITEDLEEDEDKGHDISNKIIIDNNVKDEIEEPKNLEQDNIINKINKQEPESIEIDCKINNLIGNMVEQNLRNVFRREELENQLKILMQLLQYTQMKLDNCKKNTFNFEEAIFNSYDQINGINPFVNNFNPNFNNFFGLNSMFSENFMNPQFNFNQYGLNINSNFNNFQNENNNQNNMNK